ncbi:membrane protein YqaA with SNARE-associated domain [Rhodovulum bhavnagarense]|uniref:Membrane protein YqaA with SNARE-associated domain n=1 Tax=Rhodovulum bhavnagarense TaxID=992286 RepID=A0A4R2R9W1_9RHOB|nr:YqaA family protein [Rhodovulum bhavnagarense]TCP60030.1 membrane protein YqaA with SNARE-associated domain [Rhodovulum bhavnagarense]
MTGAATLAQLATMFAAAFGAATILPFQSEVVFVGLQLAGGIGAGWLIVVASIGNVLGAVVNYVLGRWIEHFRTRRWFPVTGGQLVRAQGWWARWGVWTLLLSWAPFGDAFTVIAGMMRTPVWLFMALVTIAKTGRYAALAWATAAAAG